MDNMCPPSKVLHFRNVAPEIAQEDLTAACAEFGTVAKIVMLKTKRQAMVQFGDVPQAVAFMTHYSGTQLKVSGRNVYCSYSKHQELMGDNANKILLVTFFNPLHKQLGETLLALISVDLVYQIFSPYGPIHKIVMMSKDAGIQALVQYTAVDGAVRAKTILSGYSFHAGAEFGTFTIDAQYSNLQELTVRQNTPRSRDYLMTAAMPAPMSMPPPPSMGNPQSSYMQMTADPQQALLAQQQAAIALGQAQAQMSQAHPQPMQLHMQQPQQHIKPEQIVTETIVKPAVEVKPEQAVKEEQQPAHHEDPAASAVAEREEDEPQRNHKRPAEEDDQEHEAKKARLDESAGQQ